MSKVAYYLQEHLHGEVIATAPARRYFSTDASIFYIPPSLIVYPKGENDVRKTARFAWQLAERGRVIPITARGSGTDLSGAAIGNGIVLAFPAHMHRILELDEKNGTVIAEPGTNYGKLQQALQTHGRYIPVAPASMEYSTIGGAVGNNATGQHGVKYGSTRDYVKGLRVVLSNGEVIETKRFSKREANHKLGLSSFEGEIYRAVDALIESNPGALDKVATLGITKNSTGYSLGDVRRRDGSFDLTPLIVGSQGTLGIVTEIVLATEPMPQDTALYAAHFDDMQHLQAAILELRALPDMPSAIEMVDGKLLEIAHNFNANLLKGIISPPFPKAILLVEFDTASDRTMKRIGKRVEKIFERYATSHQFEVDPMQQDRLWTIRQTAGIMLNGAGDNRRKAVPAVGDGIVPIEHFAEFIDGVYKLFAQAQLQPALWGHAGDGSLHVQPVLDLSQVGDRQKAFRLLDEFNNLVISLGGSTGVEIGDGRLLAPYTPKLYGAEMYDLFQKVKQIFDPYGLLNPGVKINVRLEDTKPLLRQEYGLEHLAAHMPQS